MDINIGPQHPATHGVLRVVATLDGERIIKAVPHIGYLHRGVEKLCEDLTYTQITPHFDRLDYVGNLNNELSYVMAVEKLASIEVSERAQYIRVIMLELNRILSHLVWLGSFCQDLGLFATGMLWAMRDRDYIQRVMERATGGRVHYHYFTYGGLRDDVYDEFEQDVLEVIDRTTKSLYDWESLVAENEIFGFRTKGIGILESEYAVDYAVSGPMLRSTGVELDLRKVEPYLVYSKFDFNVPVGTKGDCFDRYTCRIQEMRESMKIIRQALEGLPDGPIRADVSRKITLPEGEVYVRTENPKGEFGVYLISDGREHPYRLKIRSPAFVNLMCGCSMIEGMLLPDVIAILASVDIVLGCVDR